MATRTDPRTKEDNVKEKVRYSHFIGSEAFDQGVSHTNVNSDRAILPIVGRHPQGHSLIIVDRNQKYIIDPQLDSSYRENIRTDFRSISSRIITSYTTRREYVDVVNADNVSLASITGAPVDIGFTTNTKEYLVESPREQLEANNLLNSNGFQNVTYFVTPNVPEVGLFLSQSFEITQLTSSLSVRLPKSQDYNNYQDAKVEKVSRRDIGNFYYGYQPLHNRTSVFKDAMASIKETSPAFDPVKFLTDQIYLETDSYNNDNFISGIVDLGYKADRLVYNWTFTEDQRYPMSILAFGTTEIQKSPLSNGKYPVTPGDFLHYEDVQPFYSSGSHTDQIQASHRLEVSYLPEEDSVMPAYRDITSRDLFFLDEYLEDVLVNQMTGSLSNDEGFQDPRLRDTAHGFTDYAGRQRDSIVYRNMFR